MDHHLRVRANNSTLMIGVMDAHCSFVLVEALWVSKSFGMVDSQVLPMEVSAITLGWD